MFLDPIPQRMQKDSGWIKIHRKIQDTVGYFSEPFCRNMAWIDLLLLANHDDNFFRFRGIRVDVKRGQTGVGIEKFCERWHWSRGKVERFLKELELDKRIVRQKTNITTLISIVNYKQYQDSSKADSKASSNADGQQTVKQTDTNNNDKNNKEANTLVPQLPVLDSIYEGNLVQRMVSVFTNHNPHYVIEPEVHYPPCLQIAYRIAKMKKWDKAEVLNGKMDATIKSWETIVLFVKNDEWLSTRSLIDLNSNKEWDRLFLKMQKDKTPIPVKEPAGSPIKKESDVDFDKYKKR